MNRIILALAFALLLAPNEARSQISIGQIAPGHVVGNSTAAPRVPTDTNLTALFDSAFCTTNGQTISRVSGTWQCSVSGSGLTVGSTVITGGTTGRLLYDNTGILGEYTAGAATTFIASGSGGGSTNFLRADGTWAAPPGGSGTVTNVSLTAPPILTVGGSGCTTVCSLTLTAAGTSGGIPYFSSATGLASSAQLGANLPVIGGGAGTAPTVGSRSGNTTIFATSTGALTNGHCVQIDSNGNFVDAGGTCTTGGGGGTVQSGTANQLAYYQSNGTTVVGLTSGNNGVLITSGAGVPSISSTIPAATQANITGTGTLTSGATGSGFTVALGTTTLTGILTGTYGGTGINNGANTLTFPTGANTAAALAVANVFTALNTVTNLKFSIGLLYPSVDSTTAIQVTKADGATVVMDVDTSNARVGINRTPGAFDLDVNNTANIGGTLTFGAGTITGLTVNNSPVGSTDYLIYYNASAGALRRCTVAACASAATAGVSSLNGFTGGLSIVGSTTITHVDAGGNTITLTAPLLNSFMHADLGGI